MLATPQSAMARAHARRIGITPLSVAIGVI